LKVVCLLSGGMDSSTLLAKLLDEGHRVRCLSVLYGQSHSTKELEAARTVAAYYRVEHEQVELPSGLLSGSALTGGPDIPDGHYTDPKMRATVVPNRNMILLAVAGGVAVREKCDAVAYAAHAGDHSVYPDCRPSFVSVMEDALARCDYSPIKLLTPFLLRDKSGIVLTGNKLGVPFEKTYSCYRGGSVHCGRCATCVERKEAFANAVVHDPTEYSN
jgi:7-cyano-7-deazaguanine synthase